MADSVVLIGCGNMGYAMLRGWCERMPSVEVHVVEPAEALRDRAAGTGATAVGQIGDLPKDLRPSLVVVAVKPGLVADVLSDCAALHDAGATFVSVAAGITLDAMAAALPDGAAIIRCMPNTPASIGEGMMALCAGPGVPDDAKELTGKLFAASGAVAWIEDESLMDAVTAISGSGPAYVFHVVEVMRDAGVALGLDPDTAELLAKQTVAGAGRMALLSDDPPDLLREQVTSPGGTTAAALSVLMAEDGLAPLMKRATKAARDRGVELGKD